MDPDDPCQDAIVLSESEVLTLAAHLAEWTELIDGPPWWEADMKNILAKLRRQMEKGVQ